MLPGDFTAGDVTAFASRVTVNGVARPAVSMDLGGSWRSDLPSQISPSGTTMSRGGSIEWATAQDVLDRPVTAFRDWGVWRPQKGDRIVVYAGDGTSEWERFTGVVDETTGAVGTGMSSTIVADVDPLSEDFESEALLSRMPPLSGSSQWRTAGLSPMFYVDAAMRAGNYYTTRPTEPFCAVHVPLQGSMLPAVHTQAELISGGSHGGSNGGIHQNFGAPWGLCAANFRATYRPVFTRTPSQPVQLSLMVTDGHAATGDVIAHYGGTVNYVRLYVGDDRRAVVQRRRGGELVEVCRLTSAQMQGATRVQVLIKDGQATLRNNAGAQVSGEVSGLLSDPMSSVEVSSAPDARIADVQVSHPETWQEFQYLNFMSTARIRIDPGNTATWGVTYVAPRYERRSALSMLEELADQTLSALWICEQGILNFGPSGGVRSTPSVQTVTTADDVLAMAWSDRLLAVASRVTVVYQHPVFKNGAVQGIEVARGSRQTLRSRDVVEDVYSPATDVDWYGVDGNPTKLPTFGWSEYNQRVGSYTGVTYYTGNDPAYGTTPGDTTITVTKTGLSQWTVTHEAGSFSSDVMAETTTYPEFDGSQLWERNRREPLPVFRAWALTEWTERETTRQAAPVGPTLRVVLGTQATESTAQKIRDYLHDLIMGALPQITGLEVTPDPRRQIGDTITIQSENFLGVTIFAKITGISETLSADGYAQSLNLEPTSVTTGALTYEEWEQAFPGTLTYTQWQNLRDATDTYDDFNTDPLKGAD